MINIELNFKLNLKKETKYKIALVALLFVISILIAALFSNFFIMSISQRTQDILKFNSFIKSVTSDMTHLMLFFVVTVMSFMLFCYMVFWKRSITPVKTDMMNLTPAIEIPKPAGQKQYGSARFTTPEEQKNYFDEIQIDARDEVFKWLLQEGLEDYNAVKTGEVRNSNKLSINEKVLKQGGIPVAWNVLTDKQKTAKIESIKLIVGDVHTVCFGATRCGKTRTLVIQSIVLQALSGVDMLNSDPKGELYQYTYLLLRRLGYKDFALDFKNPSRGIRYNFLQFVIKAIDENDISKAISCCWDFVDCLVKESKSGDPLWTNGEKALIAAATMQVVYDNSLQGLSLQYPHADEDELKDLYKTKHRYYQNCTNLFNYISKMTVPNPQTKNLILEDIIDVLPDDHPSKLIMAIAQSAPPKTRGSFITSALATLSLFTDPNIASMTCETDEGILDPNSKKAIFIILPDSKKTYYPLASLFVNQYYQYIADIADQRGGRLKRNFEFNLDEFGNFTQIPFFDGKMTVAAGRGIHFHLYIQSKEQLTEKYNKEIASIILDNCHYWIYLSTNGQETLNMLSEKLGKYTVLSTSSSASQNDNGSFSTNTSGSTSTSSQLIARSLLTGDEMGRITRPYLLVITQGYPSLLEIPDLHKWHFNEMLGMGDEDHNTSLREFRESIRPKRKCEKLKLWDIVPYVNRLVKEKAERLKQEAEDHKDFNEAVSENILDGFE